MDLTHVTAVEHPSAAPADGRPTILHMLPDLALGGGQALLLRNLARMRNGPFRHVVAALGGGAMEADYRAAGLPVFVLPFDSWAGLPAVVHRLASLARAERVHLIHTNNTMRDRIPGQFAGLIRHIPVVNSFHALAPSPLPFPDRPHALARIVRQRMTRLGNRALLNLNLARLVAVSEAVRASQSAWLSLPADRIRVIHNGLPLGDPMDAHRNEVRAGLGIAGRYPVIVNVGRLVEGKGQRLLIPMMETLTRRWPQACLLVAGEGEDRPLLERMITQARLERHVQLLGQRFDVPMLLAASDIFISASHYEGFGLAVLEAMAAGLPVVALFTPALLEFMADGRSGLIVHRPDPCALARAVDCIAADHDRAAAMGAEGRRLAQAFSLDATVEKMLALYAELLGSPSAKNEGTLSAE
ncbi:hypothetical protein TSH7_09065 [Azospirillum sp. TSH7]|uniref:glycosyltransferase n=1 Tax=unclassified Azospirillum TaxID=2630922 RepID=UPI000D608933|nr:MULTISPECIES: glycosyltransferase [unclassified Azospirillum]PWC62802.1 hypothetical protein TSH20_21095 [Azospirillum sp. TSH20]PWC65190.1 hypothetical protein TSH7_09065 [Azospirillum sp. TSH7]